MAKQVQLRRGDASEHETFTGAIGELTYVSDDKTLRIHDGSTAGGINVLAGVGSMNIRQIVSCAYDISAGSDHTINEDAGVYMVAGGYTTITPQSASSKIILAGFIRCDSFSSSNSVAHQSILVTGNTAAAGAAHDGAIVDGTRRYSLISQFDDTESYLRDCSTVLHVHEPATTSELRYDYVVANGYDISTTIVYPVTASMQLYAIEIG